MPSSPIRRQLTKDEFPKDWESLNKVIIKDNNTASYLAVDFNIDNLTASLMYCYIDDDPSLMVNWGHVEDLEKESRPILNTIQDVTGVSFHDSIWVQMTATETVREHLDPVLSSNIPSE